MKARLGVALFGIGVLSLAVGAGAAFYVAPTVTKIPYDLRLCDADGGPDGCLNKSVAVASGARFLVVDAGQGSIQTGTLEATTEVVPQAEVTEREMTGDLAGEAVVWDVFGTVRWQESGKVVNQYHAELALDRTTAAAEGWDKQFLQADGPEGPSDVTFAGQTYKFPFHTEQQDYQYFDRDLRKALPIRYRGTEQVEGTEAYRFEQVIRDQDLNLPADRVGFLLSQFAPGAASGRVLYSNIRTIWVEPVSGNFLKVREEQQKVLVPEQGQTTALLDADFVYTDETIGNSIDSASETRSKLLLISRYLPIGLAAFGVLAMIVGLVLFPSGGHAAAASGPRHREQ